jgi:hypothetical protein
MALTKAPDVILKLLRYAIKVGHNARYVLFDSWFSTPHTLVKIKEMGLDTIAMVKLCSRISYEYEGKRMNVKQIYARNKKRRGRSKYLLAIDVKVGKGTADEPSVPARIVCVRNRVNRKEWLALISTDTSLSAEGSGRAYHRRNLLCSYPRNGGRYVPAFSVHPYRSDDGKHPADAAYIRRDGE